MERTKGLKQLTYTIFLLLFLPSTVNAVALIICKEPRYIAYVDQRLNLYTKLDQEHYQKIKTEQQIPFEELDHWQQLAYLNQATVLSARFDTQTVALRNIEEHESLIIKSPRNDVNSRFIQAIRFTIAMVTHKDPLDDALHQTQIAKGWLALKNGNETKAVEYLMAASKVSGSPVLGSFGPDKTLARALYQRGHKKAILEYLNAIKQFWNTANALEMIDLWEKMIAVNCPTQFQFYDTNLITNPLASLVIQGSESNPAKPLILR